MASEETKSQEKTETKKEAVPAVTPETPKKEEKSEPVETKKKGIVTEVKKEETKKEDVPKETKKEKIKDSVVPEEKTSTPAVKKETTSKDGSKKKGKEGEVKVDLERIYVVPLRRGFLKVPRHKRAKKAVKTLKEFIAKHMKVVNRDLTKVKVDKYLNNEIWFRGIKKPLHKVKVKAKKIADTVYIELAEMPDYVVYKRGKDEKKKLKVDKKKLDTVVSQEAAEEKVKKGRGNEAADKKEAKEKEAAGAEAGAQLNKDMAKAEKHTAKAKSSKLDKMSQTTERKALKK